MQHSTRNSQKKNRGVERGFGPHFTLHMEAKGKLFGYWTSKDNCSFPSRMVISASLGSSFCYQTGSSKRLMRRLLPQ